MAVIDDPQVIEFLGRSRNAIVATNRPGAAPQVSPIWFLWCEDRFVLSAGVATAKAANIRRDPRISLCVDDEPGARYFAASGRVMQVEQSLRRDYALELIAKYKPSGEVLPHWEDLERNDPQRIFTFDPERIIWRDFAATAQKRASPPELT